MEYRQTGKSKDLPFGSAQLTRHQSACRSSPPYTLTPRTSPRGVIRRSNPPCTAENYCLRLKGIDSRTGRFTFDCKVKLNNEQLGNNEGPPTLGRDKTRRDF